jgi:uncharacterized protein YbjT (DUF2867 family)
MPAQRVLVLGGYGLVGSEIVRTLLARGHRVAASGRSAEAAATVLPGVEFRSSDLATSPDWDLLLRDVDVVVNAAGALQDGGRDDLAAVHDHAIQSLVVALGTRRLVQISAPGADPDAPTPFLASKGRGDASVRTAADWVILRPGLVVGAQAYGGTALLRMLAAMPWFTPLVHPEALIQSVSAEDVALAVADAVERKTPSGAALDLVETEAHTLRDVAAQFRSWLGFAPAIASPEVPRWFVACVCVLADLLGHLGWRSPLRTTAIRQLELGVVGDPRGVTRQLRSLEETLAALPATVQERRYARSALVQPLALGLLSVFWISSGAIGLLQLERAAALLDGVMAPSAATALVVAGALADIALGAAVLVRRSAKAACLGMVLLTLAYLTSGSLLTPGLWSDPLGPLVKTIPGIGLALVVWASLDER